MMRGMIIMITMDMDVDMGMVTIMNYSIPLFKLKSTMKSSNTVEILEPLVSMILRERFKKQ